MGHTVPMVHSKVRLTTSKGEILLELFDEEAPLSVANFLKYVKSGFYSGTIFHRVIPGFMVQGGGFEAGMVHKDGQKPVKNESANGIGNQRGTIAYARTQDPDSATSQFFINLVDNPGLDRQGNNPQSAGYCVFGRVLEGMDCVDAIAAVKTGRRLPHADVPLEDVLIISAELLG